MKTLELEAPPGVCTILLDDDSCEETAPAPALRNSSQEKKKNNKVLQKGKDYASH